MERGLARSFHIVVGLENTLDFLLGLVLGFAVESWNSSEVDLCFFFLRSGFSRTRGVKCTTGTSLTQIYKLLGTFKSSIIRF